MTKETDVPSHLKAYQDEALAAFLAVTTQAKRDEHRLHRGLIVAPTGAGKLGIGLAIAGSMSRPAGNVLWIEPRIELAQMTLDKVKNTYLPHLTIYSVAECEKNFDAVQKGAFGLVIFNEAQHASKPAAWRLLRRLEGPHGPFLLGLVNSLATMDEDAAAVFDHKVIYEVKPQADPITAAGEMLDGVLEDIGRVRGSWPEHVFAPTRGTIQAENLGPMGTNEVYRNAYRVSFGVGEIVFQLAVNKTVKAADAGTVLLDVEVLRLANGRMLVAFKDACRERIERPRLDGRITWIEGDAAGPPVAWVTSSLVQAVDEPPRAREVALGADHARLLGDALRGVLVKAGVIREDAGVSPTGLELLVAAESYVGRK